MYEGFADHGERVFGTVQERGDAVNRPAISVCSRIAGRFGLCYRTGSECSTGLEWVFGRPCATKNWYIALAGRMDSPGFVGVIGGAFLEPSSDMEEDQIGGVDGNQKTWDQYEFLQIASMSSALRRRCVHGV